MISYTIPRERDVYFAVENKVEEMIVLSLKETEEIAGEADRLCRWTETNADALRNGKIADVQPCDGYDFKLLQMGRNAVYRLNGAMNWYLKLPCNGKPQGIQGEINGFDYVRTLFRDEAAYLHPCAVRASLESGYLLTAEVPGTQLNYELYRRIFHPLRRNFEALLPMFQHTGRLLALFHKDGASVEAPPIRARLDDKLRRRFAKAKKLDATGEKIAKWFEKNGPFETDQTFVHANCTFRNVLVQEKTISLLDFETAGKGSRYNDLARMCSDLVLTRAAAAFPWKRANEALSAFLAAYQSVFPVDAESLTRHVALYIFERYVQVYCVKKEKESIAGIPLSKSKLNWLHKRLLENDSRAIFRDSVNF